MTGVHVIGNASAPHGQEQLGEVAELLARLGVEAEVHRPPTLEAARDSARHCVADGAERLIAVGGDGVVNIAVNAVAETGVVLGVVPAGTGNDFARALGLLEGDIEAQVGRALADASPVDAIRTDHGWVASVATLGFSGDVTARANGLRWPRGQHRYTLATLLQLPRLRPYMVTVTVDGERVGTGSTMLLAIGNTAYFGGGMRICPAARPDDGRFQVVDIDAVSRLRFLRVFPTVFSGRHVDRPEVSVGSGTAVEVDGADIDLWADGERLGPLPVRLELVPGALRVAGWAG
ncbi:MAG: YegS/Rv2252/BmrU family lipid kinase [Ilumatobacter sp.]|nr:YegS/Rv2252/BmrU family lipid kinase [Ilumatobacter sp.]